MINEEHLILCLEAIDDAWGDRWDEFTEEERTSHLNGLAMMMEGTLDLEGFMKQNKTVFHNH